MKIDKGHKPNRYEENPAQYVRGYALGAEHRYVRTTKAPPVVDSFTEGYRDGLENNPNRYANGRVHGKNE